jgi:flavin-dependent dehydrogenase
MATAPEQYDGIVVGGGPAGATAATVLAQHGHRVLLLERDHFPRYHVGESLMPFTWFTFERLGVLDWFEKAGCPTKHSVQFVSTSGKVSDPFYFFQTIKHPSATTWQVLRSDFDQMMLSNASGKGVEVRHGVTVRDVVTEGDRVVGVRAHQTNGSTEVLQARAVVDATGRDALLASKLGHKKRDPDLNKIAIFTYFQGAKRDPGIDAGATTVAYISEKGWFWYIPLANDVVSVGVVAEADYLYRETRDPEEVFCREAAQCAWIADHIAPGTHLGPVRVTGEFSYRSSQAAGDGFCLVGDAFSFLDPVFSSGVFLALKSGEMAADAIHQGLTQDGRVTAATFEAYERDLRWALDRFRQLVLAFYNETFSFGDFVRAHPDLHPQLVDALVGNVFADLAPLFDSLEEFSARTSGASTSARRPTVRQ